MHPALRVVAALGSAAVLTLLSAAPGAAAGEVARAEANALELAAGPGSTTVTGPVVSRHDGRREQVNGNPRPPIRVLDGQPFLRAGTLAQDADTRVVDGHGVARACAGLAGDGASLVSAGDGGLCLVPGQNVTLSAGTLDLSGLQLVDTDLTAGLPGPLRDAFDQLIAAQGGLQAVLGPVQDGLQTALRQLGDPEVALDLGAIQSQCVADRDRREGDTQVTDASLYVKLPGAGRVSLVELPTNPPPNTKVVTDLGVVADTLRDAVQEQLRTGLRGVLTPAVDPTGELFDAISENVLAALSKQLGPLEENLVDVTLNRQERGGGQITVTALEAKLVPAAAAFDLGLAGARIGRSECGPTGRVAATPEPSPEPTPEPSPRPRPQPGVPTAVPAGVASAPQPAEGGLDDQVALAALGALGVVAAGAGVGAYRRALRR